MDDSSKQFLLNNKVPLLMGLVGAVLLIAGVINSGLLPQTLSMSSQKEVSAAPKSVTLATASSLGLVKVDVSGAVINPGVYQLSSGARLEDAIKAAGGVSPDADSQSIAQSLNLAQKLTDGMKVYIPFEGESSSGNIAGASASQALVSVNQASASDLDKLPGVGPVTAQKIIDNRPYQALEEVYIKKAVSKSLFDKIKNQISL